MFEPVTSVDQAAILRRAHALRAQTIADQLRAFVTMLRRTPATVAKAD